MAKGLAVCTVLCALLAVCSAAAINKAAEQQLLVRQKYAYLQGEIDEWKRLGKPTAVGFPHKNGTSETGLLIDLPETASIFSPDFAANVFFYLFTRDDPSGSKVSPNAQSFQAAGWDHKKPTKFIIHGFANNIESTLFIDLAPALLKNEDCNVIGVDWGNLCGAPFYIEARNRVWGVGQEVAKLVDTLVEDGGLQPEDLHIIGHSLGAHVAGNTGKQLQSGKADRITGLDPAMPLFLLLKSDRLHKKDARTVDVIHTCGGMLGLVEAIGTVDFYPNGGYPPQPGCGLDLTGTCSHGRSYEYMTESAQEQRAFPAQECDTENEAWEGRCSEDSVGNMGVNLVYKKDGPGNYYLQTASSSPFDLNEHRLASGQ